VEQQKHQHHHLNSIPYMATSTTSAPLQYLDDIELNSFHDDDYNRNKKSYEKDSNKESKNDDDDISDIINNNDHNNTMNRSSDRASASFAAADNTHAHTSSFSSTPLHGTNHPTGSSSSSNNGHHHPSSPPSSSSSAILDWQVVGEVDWNIVFLLGGGFALSKGFQVGRS
jgi:hypothetical protein